MMSIRQAPGWLSIQADKLAARVDRLAPPPAPLAHAIARLAGGISRLPSAPPSALAAEAINRSLWPRFPAELREGLTDRVIALEITDLGVRLRLRAGPQGFFAAGDQAAAVLRIAARAAGWWRLARGLDDPDRLFNVFAALLFVRGDSRDAPFSQRVDSIHEQGERFKHRFRHSRFHHVELQLAGFGGHCEVMSLPITLKHTWLTTSGMTGLTFAGMIEDPACISGRLISFRPARGPEDNSRRSFDIFDSLWARRLSVAWTST